MAPLDKTLLPCNLRYVPFPNPYQGGSADGVADVAELSKLLAARLPVLRDWRALSATLVDDDLLEARGDGVAGEVRCHSHTYTHLRFRSRCVGSFLLLSLKFVLV